MNTRPVAIVGAGWAGCAAAVTLADAGVPVTVYEAGPVPGGRARRVERAGLPLDNGQHVLTTTYHSTFEYLRIIGTEDKLYFPDRLETFFKDSKFGDK